MADSGYPKKDEIIHASDVGKTFVKVKETIEFPTDLWTLYTPSLVRRNDDVVDALTYVDGFLVDGMPGSAFMNVRTAKASLQTLANEHHTHASSDFTELSGWSIAESSDKSLVFSVG